MNRSPMFAVLFVLVAAAGAGSAAAQDWPEVPAPPKAHEQWVGDRMRIDNVPTRIMQFQSAASRTEVIEYYRSHWSNGYTTKPVVNPLGANGAVISQKHGPYFMTVKVEDVGERASKGLISVALIAGSQVKRDPGIVPLMPGAHVLSVVESDDPGKHSRNVTIMEPQGAPSAANFYSAAFTNAGWHQIQGGADAAGSGAAAAKFMVFAREGDELQISVAADPKRRGSGVVVNLVTKDTGTAER